MSDWRNWVSEGNGILQRDFKEPKIFVVGEYDHYNERAIEKQLELAVLLHPKYISHESFKNFVFSSVDRKLTEDPEYKKDEEAVKYWKKNQPFIFSSFMYSPFKSLIKELRKEGVKIAEDGRLSTDDFRSFYKGYDIDIEIPEHINSDYYILSWWPFIRYCIDNNVDLLGCDLSQEDGAYRIKLFDKDSDIGALSISPELISDREQRAGNVISACSWKAKPVLSIHGAYHIRPKSGIFAVLQKNELADYAVIGQIPS